MEKKNNLGYKSATLLVLIMLLMVPTVFIDMLVMERENRQTEAVQEVSAKWGREQTISGPMITIPYYDQNSSITSGTTKQKSYLHLLPEHLKINGKLFPEKRYRSIYEIVVYNSKVNFTGKFSTRETNLRSIPKENLLVNEAFISVGISDLRGINEEIPVTWEQKEFMFNSGVETNGVFETGIHARVPFEVADTTTNTYSFSFDISLKGSQYLYFTPAGKVTEVNVSSGWENPSFNGAFLPDSRAINGKGFSAYWKILQLNRDYPQSWNNNEFNFGKSSFGVDLLLPVDNYQKITRSIKYAVLFVVLTFLIFFFLELRNNKMIHPFQYLLVGFGLVIFYTLLLSISEHVNYNLAYLISMVMTIGLISIYSKSVLNDSKLAVLIGGTLSILYGFIFTIIQLQDYALLMGSLGLFMILALTMYFSRKINWYGIGKSQV
ncbi:MAG: cell envelope integrity protein CreD [Flavobacteriales bacterium]